MSFGTRLYTMIKGEQVGKDSQGNVYYREKRSLAGYREKRWVLYDGKADASRVPSAWHSWLHHTTDNIPTDDIGRRWEWQKAHRPNMTGTANAYRPPGHVLKAGRRDAATGDYEPWQPT